MLSEIRKFLNQEKLYSILLICILLFYSLFFAFSHKDKDVPSPAMEKMKEVEARFSKTGDGREDMANFLMDWMESDSNLPGDLDMSGEVNLVDFGVMASHWLGFCPQNWDL